MPCRWWPLPICRGRECEDGEEEEGAEPAAHDATTEIQSRRGILTADAEEKGGDCGIKLEHVAPTLSHMTEVWGMWRWRKRAEQHIAELDTVRLHHCPLGLCTQDLNLFPIRPHLSLFPRATALNSPKTGPAPLQVPTTKDLWRKASWAAVTNEEQVQSICQPIMSHVGPVFKWHLRPLSSHSIFNLLPGRITEKRILGNVPVWKMHQQQQPTMLLNNQGKQDANYSAVAME